MDDDADRLAAVAVELVQRVRDDDPTANGRWLANVLPSSGDVFSLCFVLAAAVPDDRSWRALTAWTQDPAQTREQPCGTRRGYRRHKRLGEVPCEGCTEENRRYDRERKRGLRVAS